MVNIFIVFDNKKKSFVVFNNKKIIFTVKINSQEAVSVTTKAYYYKLVLRILVRLGLIKSLKIYS